MPSVPSLIHVISTIVTQSDGEHHQRRLTLTMLRKNKNQIKNNNTMLGGNSQRCSYFHSGRKTPPSGFSLSHSSETQRQGVLSCFQADVYPITEFSCFTSTEFYCTVAKMFSDPPSVTVDFLPALHFYQFPGNVQGIYLEICLVCHQICLVLGAECPETPSPLFF